MRFQATGPQVKISGRTLFRDGIRFLGYSGTAVTFRFHGKKAMAHLISNVDAYEAFHHAWVAVYLNEETTPHKRFSLDEKAGDYLLYEGTEETEVTITLCKYSEAEYAACGISWLETDSDTLLTPPEEKARKIQIIGDSISCGYGIEGDVTDEVHATAVENPAKAYSLLTARALDAEVQVVAWNGKGVITEYIGEEDIPPVNDWLVPMLYDYTDAGCERDFFGKDKASWERWNHSSYIPDLVIVYLGTNDSSYTRCIPERNQEFEQAYVAFLEKIHKNHPRAKLLCTLGTMDQRLCDSVEKAVDAFSQHNPDAAAVWLPLPMQKDADGLGTFWHPTAATQEKVAKRVTAKAKELMGW